jgi:hypothetical protein
MALPRPTTVLLVLLQCKITGTSKDRWQPLIDTPDYDESEFMVKRMDWIGIVEERDDMFTFGPEVQMSFLTGYNPPLLIANTPTMLCNVLQLYR